MKLYDYLKLMPDDEELTVWDNDYDGEYYFYGGLSENDSWDTLSKVLTVEKIYRNGVVVNLSEMIKKHMKDIEEAGLFNDTDIDTIMKDMPNILAGNVSEKWMEKFAAILFYF